jgi:hypothetical protein
MRPEGRDETPSIGGADPPPGMKMADRVTLTRLPPDCDRGVGTLYRAAGEGESSLQCWVDEVSVFNALALPFSWQA